MQQQKKVLVLLAHGSRDPRWQEPFHQLTQQIIENQSNPVYLAFMELCSPSLEEVVAQVDSQQYQQLEIIPLFFSAGRHLRHDVPQQIEELARKYPQLSIHLQGPIGLHPKMTQTLTELIQDM
ncbi:sirohydrochlorin chelatase [Oceanospirillum beijerinckii]|uniref:sirohydrochlorin chelatase n=1 Tax=Oceanospirillum beijerinckii TaxID=64976 RepID=UPI000428B664|nr:CbiX/SirB N-terminal domain-containing protein [Oceanospirillum beijerinckii]